MVLPEAHVWVDGSSRERWIAATTGWAQRHRFWLAMGYVDMDRNSNRLLLLGPDGTVAADYEKQHPVPFLDLPRHEAMPPAMAVTDWGMISGVICFDREFPDLNQQVAARGGVLAAPTNDWRQVADLHTQIAPWTAVQSGAPLVAATTHGHSLVVDATGQVVATASSFAGPVVLVAEVAVPQGPLPRSASTNWVPLAAWALLLALVAQCRRPLS